MQFFLYTYNIYIYTVYIFLESTDMIRAGSPRVQPPLEGEDDGFPQGSHFPNG